jgi:hypothetical protein
MPHHLKMVGSGEPCPCGSGRTYLECCLGSTVRYFRDEGGAITRYDMRFEKKAPSTPSPDGVCPDCGGVSDSLVALVSIEKDGSVGTIANRFFMRSLDGSCLQDMIKSLEVVRARLLRAYLDPANKGTCSGEVVTVFFAGLDDDDDISLGGEEKFSDIPLSTLETALGSVEGLKTILLIFLVQQGLVCGMDSLLDAQGFGEGDEDEDDL